MGEVWVACGGEWWPAEVKTVDEQGKVLVGFLGWSDRHDMWLPERPGPDLLRCERPDATVSGFSFRALRPVFAGAPLILCGSPDADGGAARLWALDADGQLAMRAEATLTG